MEKRRRLAKLHRSDMCDAQACERTTVSTAGRQFGRSDDRVKKNWKRINLGKMELVGEKKIRNATKIYDECFLSFSFSSLGPSLFSRPEETRNCGKIADDDTRATSRTANFSPNYCLNGEVGKRREIVIGSDRTEAVNVDLQATFSRLSREIPRAAERKEKRMIARLTKKLAARNSETNRKIFRERRRFYEKLPIRNRGIFARISIHHCAFSLGRHRNDDVFTACRCDFTTTMRTGVLITRTTWRIIQLISYSDDHTRPCVF